jgi:NAD(P)-dependent dehydrogenase (short-subunit alcohol dehydrogenase family)
VVARTEDQLAETVALIEQAGGRAIAVTADVTDERAIEHMVSEVERQLGPVDLLVNNAGSPGPVGPMWQNDAEEWWHCMDVNLRGPFLCSRAVLSGMVARRRGRIITTASGAGLRAGRHGSAYCISKAAVIRLSESLAVETKDHGVSVFAIDPGFVRTALTEGAAESPEDEKWLGGLFRRLLAEGRDVPPERAAQLMLFLASGKADALSGCYFSIHNDLAEIVSRVEEIQDGELYTLRLRT